MATRRPQTRSKPHSTNAILPPRSRSALAKPGSSRTTPIEEHQELTASSGNATQPPPKQTKHTTDDAETNIQVVIRCRRRSEREIEDKSPIIVSSSGPKSHEVTVETSTPSSSLGVITLAPARTYPFDLVFGPEADQAMIYHDVVSPMLEEVLMGYNCTLFAYGQTGTGKTYTMQGDLTPTPMGNPSAHAGMIPRVLFRLFHSLETTASDYSVKVSFIELYNEELRDLLATDLSAPAGSIQPMGMASKDSNLNNGGNGGLKIFDDANKRGVLIQGVEEISVKNSADALALLTKGSHRRQIAATKFNDHSSRSHSVFSITVHVKESSPVGDDLLKIGKLNLVDLAGSENIGRSGAENKRAREAGMINQSLLTLGRVINALVDKSQHVPYRESKLTRLLQDSLGGRTKTCIVATVSPARSNMEETLSTLDYAMRAKSIRNKPELNQRMTRNSLLKEYVAEIERLKADLLAAREKNGIFFAEETWNQLNAEQELRETEIIEARKRVEIVENQMRAVRDEFEQSIALLMKTDGELKETRDRLKQTEEALGVKKGELKVVTGALEEEILVRKAHQETEIVLNGIAGGLNKVVKQSVNDIGALFEKLHRKSTVFNSNQRAVMNHGTKISQETKNLSNRLEEFIKTSCQRTLKLRTGAKQFEIKELEILAVYSTRIEEQLRRLQDALTTIQKKDSAEDEALMTIHRVIEDTREAHRKGFRTWGDSLQKSCEGLCTEAELVGVDGINTVAEALKVMNAFTDTIIREAQEYVDAERESWLEVKDLANKAANAEIAHLRQQNEMLTRLLKNEKVKADKSRDQLLERISGLLGDFTKERDAELKEAVEAVQSTNQSTEEELKLSAGGFAAHIDNLSGRGKESGVLWHKRSGEGKRMRDGALKSLTNVKSTFGAEINKLKNTFSGSIDVYETEIQRQAQDMDDVCNTAFERHSQAKRARIDTVNSMATEASSEYHYLKRGMASTSRDMADTIAHITSECHTLTSIMDAYRDTATTNLATLLHTTQKLVEEGTKEDRITNTTPRKRAWEYTDEWELTKSREAVLRDWREKGVSGVGKETTSEYPPLPQDYGESDVGNETEMPSAHLMKTPQSDTGTWRGRSSVSPPASLASSASSASLPPLAPTLMIKKAGDDKSAFSTTGTLTDSRAPNIQPRLRRAAR